MEGNETKHRCSCCCRPEFWIALLKIRDRLYLEALLDFVDKGYPWRSEHLHLLWNCIDDYLDIAREEGLFVGSD